MQRLLLSSRPSLLAHPLRAARCARAGSSRLACAPRAMTTKAVEEARDRHKKTLAAIYAHPVSHSLKSKDVLALVESLGGHHSGENGSRARIELLGHLHYLLLSHSGGHSAGSIVSSPAGVLGLRRFLESIGIVPPESSNDGAHYKNAEEHIARAQAAYNSDRPSLRTPEVIPKEALDGKHALLLVSHLEAKLWTHQSPGAAPRVILPPADAHVHLHHKASAGHSAPPPAGKDFEPVLDVRFAKLLLEELRPFTEIVLAGHGKGKSSAVDALLNAMPDEQAGRVARCLRLSEGHYTDNELLARMRHLYTQRGAAGGA